MRCAILDHKPQRGECALPADVGGGACPIWGEQPDLVGGELSLVVATPEAFVGDHDLGGGAGNRSASGSYSFSFAGTIV
jgi:hypothetical protein